MSDPIIPPTKTCTKCGVEKPATREYFHYDKKAKDSLRNPCKECRRSETGRYRLTHVNELREKSRLYYHQNKDREREKRRKHAKDHRPEHRFRHSLWRKRNREKLREINRQWRKDNPEQCRAACRRRRARKYGTGGRHTKADIELQYSSQRGKCWHCGKKLGHSYHVDHLTPIAKGGSDNPRNLVISCPQCNQSKNDKMTWEWNGKLL